MSPKSKGRPKGRGRPPPKGQGRVVRPLAPVDRAIRAAGMLGDLESPLSVQRDASDWVGQTLTEAGMGQRRPERDLATALGGELGGGHRDTAYRALLALRSIAAPDDVALIDVLLHDHRLAGATRPLWADQPTPVPTAAWRLADPWGSFALVVVGYGDPEPHELLVEIGTVGGLRVGGIRLLDPGSAEDLGRDSGPGGVTIETIDPAAALARIVKAITTTDRYWPPQRDPDYVQLRTLALARSREYAVELEWAEITADERRGLLDDFASQTEVSVPPDVAETLADTFIDFGDAYVVDGVLAWSPGEVERFMLDWVLRKVVLDPPDWEALPEVLRAWVAFALRRKGIAEADIVPVVEAVDELTPDFRKAAGDDSSFGPGKQLLMAMQAEGADLTDRDALERAMRAHNAQQLAERLRDGGST